jgi:hypothetical protein
MKMPTAKVLWLKFKICANQEVIVIPAQAGIQSFANNSKVLSLRYVF